MRSGKFLAYAAIFVALASSAYADSFGSAVGGARANQSSLSGGLCLSSPVVLSDGQQRALLVDCTTGALITSPSASSTSVVTSKAVVSVPGTQTGLAIATATAPTIPAMATYLLAQAQGTNNTGGICLYWQDDGTNPTASAGQGLAAGASMWRKVSPDAIKFIAATGATCAVTISYYKDAA